MLSEIHNANFLAFWLKEWLRLGDRIPSEFNADMSLALLNAGVCAFTDYTSLASYTNALFRMILGDTNIAKPSCFIRIDIAHLMKNIASFKQFALMQPKVREIYIRCVALLMMEQDIHKAREIIKSVLIMAYSSTEGMHELIMT